MEGSTVKSLDEVGERVCVYLCVFQLAYVSSTDSSTFLLEFVST